MSNTILFPVVILELLRGWVKLKNGVMKVLLILAFFLSSVHVCSSQERVNGYISFSQNINRFFWLESNAVAGVLFPLKTGSISTSVIYVYGGNLPASFKYEKVRAYTMQYHLLGGEVKYRIRNSDKIYSPTIQLSALSDIGSTYRGKYLKTIGTITNNIHDVEYYFSPANTYGTQALSIKNFTAYYVSTPFEGNLLVGNEFKLLKGLFLNFGIGFTIRGVKIRYKEWNKGTPEPESDISDPHSLTGLKWKKEVSLTLGLNYTFSFKKKEK